MKGSEWYSEMELALQDGHAVVLKNSASKKTASFADLIVFGPGRAVVLVHTKFYRPTTPLTPAAISEELWKMGCDQKDAAFYAAFANNISHAQLPPEYQHDVGKGSALFKHLKAHVKAHDFKSFCQQCNGLNQDDDLPLGSTGLIFLFTLVFFFFGEEGENFGV